MNQLWFKWLRGIDQWQSIISIDTGTDVQACMRHAASMS